MKGLEVLAEADISLSCLIFYVNAVNLFFPSQFNFRRVSVINMLLFHAHGHIYPLRNGIQSRLYGKGCFFEIAFWFLFYLSVLAALF